MYAGALLLCVDEGTEEQEEGRTGCQRPTELEASVAVRGLMLLGSPGRCRCLDHMRTLFLEPLLSTSLPCQKPPRTQACGPVSPALAGSLHVRKFRAVCRVTTLNPHAREPTGSLGRWATAVRRLSSSPQPQRGGFRRQPVATVGPRCGNDGLCAPNGSELHSRADVIPCTHTRPLPGVRERVWDLPVSPKACGFLLCSITVSSWNQWK